MPSANDPNQGVNVRFHMHEKKTSDGTPILDGAGKVIMEEYCEITHSGDAKYMRDQKVTDEDRERWPNEYQRFKDGVSDQMIGTRLLDAAGELNLSVHQVNQLISCNIYTVEMLANVTDGNLHHVGMGGQLLRDKARTWLEDRMTRPDPNEMQAQLQAMQAELAALKAEKRGPGRPRKEAA